MSTKHAVVWFEIPARDFDRTVEFYQTVLEIKLDVQEMPGWPRMATFPHDMTAGVGGCIVDATPNHQPTAGGVTIYLSAGDDLAGPLSRVEAAGGKAVLPKTLINDEIGYMAHFLDPEGNRLALHSYK